MGCIHSVSSLPTSPTPTAWLQSVSLKTPVSGAGCMFVNDTHTHTLLGIHSPRSKNTNIRMCGFGGKAEGDEPWWQTAFRETIEELFHPPRISFNIYHALTYIEPVKILQQETSNYITLVYTFDQLRQFLTICNQYGLEITTYSQFPTCANDLVMKRNSIPEGAEIMHILYWPLKNRFKRFRITSDFAEDMRAIPEG